MDSNDHVLHGEPADTSDGLPTGQRGPVRDSLFLAAQIRVGDTVPFAVRVRNLSEGGLMAELPHAVDPNAKIQVEVRGIGWIAGRIAWQTAGRAGISFDTPIDPQRARKPVVGGPATIHASYSARPAPRR